MNTRIVRFKDQEGFPVYINVQCIENITTLVNPFDGELIYQVRMQKGELISLDQEEGTNLSRILDVIDNEKMNCL